MQRIAANALFVITSLLIGCGGGNGSSNVAAANNPAAPSAAAASLPFSASAVPFAPPSIPSANALLQPSPYASISRRNAKDATATGGWLGVSFGNPQVGVYFGAYANQTIYQMNFTGHILYAPTMRAPQSCIEVTTSYYAGNTAIGFWNFCSTSASTAFAKMIAVDQTWYAAHVRNLGNNLPQYTVEVYVDAGLTWHALLYNYSLGQWEDDYDASGYLDPSCDTSGRCGWDQFEVHFTDNTCPALPGPIESTSLQVYAPLGWVNPWNSATAISTIDVGQCAGSGVSPYVYTQLNDGWSVTN